MKEPSADHGWAAVKEAFGEALELVGREREHFLDRLKSRRPETAEQVRAMLAAHADSGDFLERSPAKLESLTDEAWIGRAIGAYRIESKAGEGGMGRVFLAHRDDGAFERRVAIKVVAGGAAWLHNLDLRLARERSILAALDHPAIARLLDGGTTEDGFAYLVLEWVDGEPIDEWCDQRCSTISQRIELLRSVCEAVASAHSRLVVHGDLKPSNLMVQKGGSVKLLDFGIAELLHGGDVEESGAFPLPRKDAVPMPADTGSLDLPSPFTPRYASPEQRRGESVDTLSDVYSLGVVAHVLLTGRLPTQARLASASVDDLQRNPAHRDRLEEIAQSRATTPRRLLRWLRGDLDAVLARALAQDPDRRYDNVPDLADDLRNLLQRRPVAARPASPPRRLWLWARRSPILAAALVGLTIAAIGLGLLSQRLAQQRRIAMSQRAAAEEVAAFTVDLFDIVDRADATAEVSARALIEQGERRLVQRLQERPRMRARLLHTLGTAAFRIGMDEKARGLWAEAVEVRRLLAEDSEALVASGLVGPEELEHDTAESLVALADVALRDRAADQAEPLLSEAISRLGARPRTPERALTLAIAESRLGLTRMRYGDRQGSEELTRAGFERCLELLPALNDTPGCWVAEGIQVRSDRAGVLMWQGRQREGLRLIDEARALTAEVKGPDHPQLHALDQNRALIRFSIGEVEPAIEIFEASAQRLARDFGAQHPQTQHARNLLVNGYAAAGLDRAARRALRQHWQDLQEERATLDAPPELTAQQIWMRHFLGYLEAALGDVQASEKLLLEEPPLPILELRTESELTGPAVQWVQEERRVLEWLITLENARGNLIRSLELAQLLNRSLPERDIDEQELELLAASLLDNDRDTARSQLQRVRDLYRSHSPEGALLHLWPAIYLSELELIEGHPESVEEHLDAAAKALANAPADSWLVPAAEALRAAAHGQWPAARRSLGEVEQRLDPAAVEARRLRRAVVPQFDDSTASSDRSRQPR